MRKKVYSFTLSEEVMVRFKKYSTMQGRSASSLLEVILSNFFDEKNISSNPANKIQKEYVDTPEDIETMKNFGKGKEKKKTQEDLDFEQSIKDSL